MELVYQFTEDERRVIEAAQARLMQTLQVIADLHEIKGNVGLAPDNSGFVRSASFGPSDPPPGN